jgi:hypothetical protein
MEMSNIGEGFEDMERPLNVMGYQIMDPWDLFYMAV